ncbi:LPS export ABC transporter periplasmic protein LptC [Bauldia sp.]|uniref:LPS export ABC transporter periplasmic protein LptC n=1 Tax=Bauldia sp. TaxID=2575872 RepID=UPI003BAA7D1C
MSHYPDPQDEDDIAERARQEPVDLDADDPDVFGKGQAGDWDDPAFAPTDVGTAPFDNVDVIDADFVDLTTDEAAIDQGYHYSAPIGGSATHEPQEINVSHRRAEASEPMTVAATGVMSERNIRFDPTQERGTQHYRQAHRHSRRVRLLKVLLPTLAAIGVLGFVAFVQFAPTPGDVVITLSGVNVEDESVTMERPHISGFEGTKRAYEVRATEAIQDLNNPNIVTLHAIKARLGLGDGETANIRAARGIYDGDTKKLTLKDGITLNTTNGYEATFESAQVNVDSGRMTSNKPLEIVTDHGTVRANAMVVRDDGKHVIFKDGVNVVYTPPEDPDEPVVAPAEPDTTAAVTESAT